jgi:hypothetical protein
VRLPASRPLPNVPGAQLRGTGRRGTQGQCQTLARVDWCALWRVSCERFLGGTPTCS